MTSIKNRLAEPTAWFKLDRDGALLSVGGAWTIQESARLDGELAKLNLGASGPAVIDGSNIERLESAGAWLLLRTKRALEAAGKPVSSIILPDRYAALLEDLDQTHTAPPIKFLPPRDFRHRLERIGRAAAHAAGQGYRILGYLGRISAETIEMIAAPRSNFKIAAIMHQVEETGINALPIVGLLAFLIGVVLAYQGADQLKRFGEEVFTINLLGVCILRRNRRPLSLQSLWRAGQARPSLPRSAQCASMKKLTLCKPSASTP